MSGRKSEPDSRIAFMDRKRAIPAIAGFMVFVFISYFVATQNTQAFDSVICSYVYGHRSAGLTGFFKAVTYMGNWQTVSLLCIILLLLPGTRIGVGVPVSFAAILATCIQKSLKLAFHRARPDIAMFLVREGGYSFPSAHSFTNFVFYGLLIYLCRQKIKNRRLADAITVLLVILIFLIGISRVYLGVHFPTDVLGAWALALCVLMILISGVIKFQNMLNSNKIHERSENHNETTDKNLDDQYEEYLSDESKMTGFASTISFPETREEISDIVNQMRNDSVGITVQGGRTGICGAAVPQGGHVMNLSRMTKTESLRKTERGYLLKVQTGVPLSELRRMISRKSFDTDGWDEDSLKALAEFKNDGAYFWPPDPTETSAAVGGMLGTNAQSITDFRYRRLTEYVDEIELIDAEGRLFTTKNTELYLGSEGMYGIFTAATLRLVKAPLELWGICFFFEKESALLHFAEQVLAIPQQGSSSVAAVEYIGRQALDYIRRLKEMSSKLQELPDIDMKYAGIIYIELHGDRDEEIEQLMEALTALAASYGVGDSDTWALSGEAGIEKIKLLRHSVPESVNNEIKKRAQKDPRITKLSTDLTTGYHFSEDVLFYQKEASAQGLEAVIFGHVPENRIHVNIISNSCEEYEKGKKLLEAWYRRALESGGTVFREHGVGKVKRDLFNCVVSGDLRAQIAADKKSLDPQNLLNPGNKLL